MGGGHAVDSGDVWLGTGPDEGQAMTNAGNSTPRSGAAERVKDTGAQAADSAEQAGQQAITSRPFKVLLTVGLIAYGVVHILIGWIALQIAWIGRGQGQEASQKGALAEMAQQPFGVVLLWITVIGLFALAVWQLIEAI